MANGDDPGSGWRKFFALVLAVAILGLPINSPAAYALLAIMAVAIFANGVRGSMAAWLGAGALVVAAVYGQSLLAPPRIDEGHNVFLPSPALERGLPADVYRHLKGEFDRQYPDAQRCAVGSRGCWQDSGFPDRPFAFSADGILQKSSGSSPAMSRSVTEIDFSDPVWLRLGFINENKYNWYTAAPDVHRADRDRRFYMGLNRWHLTMPWFEMIRLPAAMVGGKLCWRGDVLWEGANERFALWRGDSCRDIEPGDAGRRVVGIGIKPDQLAMRLTPPWSPWLLGLASQALMIAAAVGLILTLVRFEARRVMVPLLLIGLACIVIAIDDASFLGGVRPLDGGDDGLFYEDYGRTILENFLAGNYWAAFEGGEKVFYYGGPGLRYFRALEHVIFGDSFLGYLSLVLLLPVLVLSLFRRFTNGNWAIALGFLFLVPLGTIFGTSFADYLKWASRGFADPAAYILFIAGLLPIIGAHSEGPTAKFTPAFFGALLLALGICMKPIVAPAAAVLLGGAGLYSLCRQQWLRLAGLCIGFLPVFSMALHNWIFGRAFVLFSANSGDADLLVMPPSAYFGAVKELVTLEFGTGYVSRGFFQFIKWLSGPAESVLTIPLNAAGVAILIFVVVRGRTFDPWLRVIGASALAQHAVALFYNAGVGRYHFLTWFLTMVVVMVFMHDTGMGWLSRRYPVLSARIASNPLLRRLATGLARLQKASS